MSSRNSSGHAIPRFAALPRSSVTIAFFLFIANLLIGGWALLLVEKQRISLAVVVLAYTLGLKHAFDADHIAAIDNVSRKLVGERKRPLSAGLYFSLGHSTVVVLATVAVALAGPVIADRVGFFKNAGGILGASISGGFLVLIAAINAVGLWRAVGRPQDGPTHVHGKFLARICRPFFRLITQSWHMYPLGFLFGLGFDTATEIVLLALAAGEAARTSLGLQVLVFPALFAAGMSSIDALDGLLAARAYEWAFGQPERTRRYNIIVTLTSIFAALGVGCLQLTTLFTSFDPLSDISGWVGAGLCAVLIVLWLSALSGKLFLGASAAAP